MQNLKAKSYEDSIARTQSIMEGEIHFSDNLPVSRKSVFGDSVWDWNEEYNRKVKTLPDSKLKFNWKAATIGNEESKMHVKLSNQAFTVVLPKDILNDIKRAAFIYFKFPALTRSRNTGTKNAPRKATTIIHFIKNITNFLGYIYLQNLLPNAKSHIKCLSDITLTDLRRNIEDYPYRKSEVKKALAILSNPVIRKNLINPPDWNITDIRNTSIPKEKEGESIATLPDDLFRLLSDKSRTFVLHFLQLLNEPLFDKGPVKKLVIDQEFARFPEKFDSYIERKKVLVEKGKGWESNHTKLFAAKFNSSVTTLHRFLVDVQAAAQVIVLLYTGMRYSEAAALEIGCLKERDNIHFINSSIIKGKQLNAITNNDEWIAIDIVCDAVRALELLTRCNFNKFLLSSFEAVKAGKMVNPLSLNGLTSRLNSYLSRIDAQKRWSDWSLSPHQFRHGLVYQLAKADVGLTYITRQLHHYYTKINESSYRVNENTLVYGMQKQRLLANATGLNARQQADNEILQSLYGENRQFAGGGAAIHIERTDAFFKGEALHGEERKKYIEMLAKTGVAIVPTAVGFCTRNHVQPSIQEKEVPPCIGDLNCNPATCKHSIVPEARKADVIKFYLEAVEKLKSPDQIHLKKHWEKIRDSYAAMLNQLKVNINSLK